MLICQFGFVEKVFSSDFDNFAKFKPPIKFLTTYDDHIEALENAFITAKKRILITNYGKIYWGAYKQLENLILQASAKGVKIYYRFNYDDKATNVIPKSIQQLFCTYGVDYDTFSSHAKIIAVDHHTLIVGSFNWLTELNSPWRSLNRSLVFQSCDKNSSLGFSNLVYSAIETMWLALKYYRNRDFRAPQNQKAAYHIRRGFMDDSKIYELTGPASGKIKFTSNSHLANFNEKISSISYKFIIDNQRLELLKLFEMVQKRIVIFSPFVSHDNLNPNYYDSSGKNTYQRDFVYGLLENVLKKGIEICFCCLPEHKSKINTYLNSLLKYCPNQIKILTSKLHTKTLIVDDAIISEGSFNWLSTSRDEVNPNHKFEAIAFCSGNAAQKEIERFYKTNIGKKINAAFSYSNSNSLFSRKRKYESDRQYRNKRYKRTNLINNEEKNPYFFHREKELEKECWIYNPLWVKHSPTYYYLIYNNYYDIMSRGRNPYHYGGFCARINKKIYLRDRAGKILYFSSVQLAKIALAESLFKEH